MKRNRGKFEGGSKAIKTAEKLLLIVALVLATVAAARGQNVVTPKPQRQVVVSIPDRELAVLEDGRVIRTFAVSVGAAASPSPVGEFRIINRVANPTYYHPGVVIPAGSDSPIGPRWIGLSRKGYGIHGTNEPRSIGKAASHGCIRLRNSDIRQLFAMLRVGDTVEIHTQRDEQIARIFGGAADAKDGALAEAQSPSVAVAAGQ